MDLLPNLNKRISEGYTKRKETSVLDNNVKRYSAVRWIDNATSLSKV